MSLPILPIALMGSADLKSNLQPSTPDNAGLTLSDAAEGNIQAMIDTNFQFDKQITDDPEFAKDLFELSFDRYRKRAEKAHAVDPQH